MIVQQMNVTTNQITEVVHIDSINHEVAFDSVDVDRVADLESLEGVRVIAKERVYAAGHTHDGYPYIQLRGGDMIIMRWVFNWQAVIGWAGLHVCAHSGGDYVRFEPQDDAGCPCYGCSTMRHACTGAF